MGEITITLTPSGDVMNGSHMTSASWASGFDHAALVTAGRSRADAYDFWMYHATGGGAQQGGLCQIVSVAGANTASCKVGFLTKVDLLSPYADAGYRLVFGDLGQQTSRAIASGLSDPGTVAVSASVPALTLPTPSHAVTRSVRYRRGEHLYSDSVVTRRRDYNESPLTVLACEWRDPTPEDWYAVRAWHDAALGGAVYGSLAWESGDWRPLPGSLALSQNGRGSLYARLEVEGVPA